MTRFSLQDPELFRRQAYIAGHWCDADNGATLATGEILGTVPRMGAAETRRAIDAAKSAWVDWRRKPAKVGNGFEPGVLQGPLIDQAAVEKVEEHIQDAVSQGAQVLLGGKRHDLGQTFFEPTVLAGVTPQMKVAKEETFRPLPPLFRFETDEQAMQIANDTEFGLASYFYSRDIGRILRAAEGLESGMVGIKHRPYPERSGTVWRCQTIWPRS
jgi:acyl-CoA reductase-like NAD-dependent aldehyde dehydrogenase